MSRPELDEIDAALRGEGELAVLVEDVRATAPRMSPELALRLEEIVSAPARKRRVRWQVLAPALATAVVALVALVVVLRAQEDSVTRVSGTRPAPAASANDEAAPQSSPLVRDAAGRAAAPIAPPPSTSAQSVPRRVERDVSLTLAASPRDFTDVTDDVIRTADRFDGIVQRSTVDQEGRSGRASFDLRIPVRRLDGAVAALSRLAHVRARSAGTQDVTGAYNAAADRLADARAERRALLRALARATTVPQTNSIRARLREVRERIGRAGAAVALLKRRTDLARVAVTVETSRDAAVIDDGDDKWTPGDALRDAGRVLEVAAGVAVVAAAALLPAALLAALALAAARAARRRRREAALG